MISLLIFDRFEKEGQELLAYSRNSVALLSDDQLKASVCCLAEDIEGFLVKKDLMDAAIVDVTAGTGLSILRKIRDNYDIADIMILADKSISPMKYLTPSIRAASLLLRPFSAEEAQNVFMDFFRSIYRDRREKGNERALVMENKQGKIPIPFSKIYYLEVREKRIFVRLKEKEYCKYGSLEEISRELPKEFLQCHRSFIVNTQFIRRVKLSDNMVYLEDDICVPLSRSYKGIMKEYMNGLRRV